MNISKAFSFVFEDKEWVSKVLVGGLMLLACLTIVLIPFVTGYTVKLMGNAGRGGKQVLPAWKDWGELYKTGLIAIAINLIYGIILGVVIFILKNLPILKSFTWVVQLVFSFYLPVAVLFFAVSGKFEDAFAYEKIFRFVAENLFSLIMIWIVSLLLLPLTFAGLIVFIIGFFFTVFYALLVRSYLYGDLYRISKK